MKELRVVITLLLDLLLDRVSEEQQEAFSKDPGCNSHISTLKIPWPHGPEKTPSNSHWYPARIGNVQITSVMQ